MDPFSHAIVGATCAGALRLSGISTRTAIVSGALAGMAPDLDILIRSSQYPLLALKYHRHFTHALAFAPLGALLTALPLFGILRLMKLQPRFYALYLAMLLGFLSHGILDAMTNYGTHLLHQAPDHAGG